MTLTRTSPGSRQPGHDTNRVATIRKRRSLERKPWLSRIRSGWAARMHCG